MGRMTRKQIYIDSEQDRLLKRKASELRVSESELIRDGIEQTLRTGAPVRRDTRAWEAERKRILSFVNKGGVRGKRTWRREELYDRKISG